MSLEFKLKTELKSQGADFIYYVDISQLSDEENKHYPNAVLIGITLSPKYIQKITTTPDYVSKMVENNQINQDEFHQKETKTDSIADIAAFYLTTKGYAAYSQSEDNIYLTGFYNEKMKSTPLPHKTIAGLAGLGWIGKNNLLVTPEFGCAISMCTVLTNAPLTTVSLNPLNSWCGNCNICIDICPVKAIHGNKWNIRISRDELVDAFKCHSCLKCLVHCPWTQNFMLKFFLK